MQTHLDLIDRPPRTATAGLAPLERLAASIVGLGVVGFGILGLATHMPSTVSYVLTVSVGAAVVTRWRHRLSPPLCLGLAFLAIGHLAGGLIRVGDDVLYNAHVWSPVFQFDHLEHASGVLLGSLFVWRVLVPPTLHPQRRAACVAVCLLAGLGLGAVNETIEFLTTLAHDGSHVGGYENTGWDFVANVVGAGLAGLWLGRSTSDRRAPR